MPSVWTLRQRGISNPSPAPSRDRSANPSRRLATVVATGTSWPSNLVRLSERNRNGVSTPP